ncbi:type III secretion system HrpP C-terminal domain-containing protein [Dickeya zeae]|uniref:type III secretion system HrpP C-terminal domain-containing protein n=1 Tax=Dickeya zeae TaxID=204042 RepID=UPI000C9B3164|nr:type III secretion system HrpP C-terminal domain-containing protein [Dickeya zeae]AUQ25693.1 type III secretion protein HrpP [Dickeya zeae]UJR58765.1 type III secretion protein HrpP [Dickeya zeae]
MTLSRSTPPEVSPSGPPPLSHQPQQDLPGYMPRDGYSADDDTIGEPFARLSGPDDALPDVSWLPFGPSLALYPALTPTSFQDTPVQTTPVMPAGWSALESSLADMPSLHRGEPLSFSVQLPQLGSVDVRMVALPANGWDVSLRFGKTTYERLKNQRDACRRSLASTLRAPVRLQFDSREDDDA